jgi:hypothetical protein
MFDHEKGGMLYINSGRKFKEEEELIMHQSMHGDYAASLFKFKHFIAYNISGT